MTVVPRRPLTLSAVSLAVALLAGLLALLALLAAGCGPQNPRPAARLATAGQPAPVASAAQIMATLGQLPLAFEPNAGQTAPEVDFLARGPGYTVFLTPMAAVLALQVPDGAGSAVRLELVDAAPTARPSGQTPLPGTVSYLHGNNPADWQAGLPTYATVAYPAVWPGIDLVYYGRAGQLEYDLVVAPGAAPEQAHLRVDGASALELDADGGLLLHTEVGTVRQPAPLIYQDDAGGRQVVDGGYVLEGTEVRFAVGPYDPTRPLVIDPVLVYSTYLGGSGFDAGNGIAVDGSGQVYLTGETQSANFPTTAGAFQTTSGGSQDAFVTKLNSTGSGLVYSTYLGGSGFDVGLSIAVDGSSQVYLTGETQSANFPTTAGAFQTTSGGSQDAFVTKLNSTGSGLVYSTYLGGSGFDELGNGIAVDGSGQAYLTGETGSTDFPTTAGAFQTTSGGSQDAFVTKLNSGGTALVYSTYLGGSGLDEPGNGIAVDGSGQVYLTGETQSTDFPTTAGAFQTTSGGGQDAFVTKLNSGGTALVYSTYLGGSGGEQGFGIAVDGSGQAYLTGFTQSANFPTTAGVVQPTFGGGSLDAFVTKLNSGGTALIYSTYLGGSSDDAGLGIAVDGSGQAYLTGETGSTDFPTTADAFQTTLSGSVDAFVRKLNSGGTALVYSTYLGGSDFDAGLGIAVDGSGQAYLTGFTQSANFPTTAGVVQPTVGGNRDAFVTKLDLRLPPTVTTSAGSTSFVENAGPVAVDSGLTVVDPDSTNLTGATVTISGNFVAAEDVMGFANTPNITGVYANGTLTLSGTDTVANYQTALRSVTYTDSSDAPNTAARIVSFQVTDDMATTSNGGTRDIAITAVNDPPVNTVPGAQTTPFTTPLVFSTGLGNAMSIADVDAGSGNLQVTLGVTTGTLTLGSTAGLTVTGNGTANVVATGPLANLNAGLRGLTFTPTDPTAASATLTLTTNDQGNAGTGGPLSAQNTVAITITPTPTATPSPTPTLTPTATAPIAANDASALWIYDLSVTEGNGGPTSMTFTVDLNRVTTAPVTVQYATADGSATAADGDYQAVSGTLTFNPGELTKTVTVTVNGDTKAEPDETFTLTLSNPGNASIAKGQAVGVIVNDDIGVASACSPRPPVAVTSKATGDGRLQVTLTAGTGGPNGANRLTELRFGAGTNALIDVAGQNGRVGPFSVLLTGTPTSVTFFVRRVTPGQATTVPVIIVDSCGDWPSFVGGGPGAF